MNHKTERIKKLLAKGMSVKQIATKIGYGDPPTEEGRWRVQDVIDDQNT